MNDVIDRQAAIDVLDVLCQEHRYKIPGKIETYSQYNEAWQDALDRAEGAIFNLPSAQPEPCEDAVGRDAVVRFLDDWISALDANCHHQSMADLKIVKNDFKNLPSAQPEQRWIPCSERMPDGAFGCLVTVWDTNPVTMDEFENVLPYFVGWDGEQWNDADGEQCPFEVIAWMPLPEVYKGEAE